MNQTPRQAVRAALARLGIRRLLLGIHDSAFPSRPHEELGRGSPHAEGADDVLRMAHDQGFDGLVLGPQGATTPGNPSPYDGAYFSREPLSVGLAALGGEEWARLLPPERLRRAVEEERAPTDRVHHARARAAVTGLLDEATSAFLARRASGEGGVLARIGEELERFQVEESWWLAPDALHELLRRDRGAPLGDRPRWEDAARELPVLLAGREGERDGYALVQLVLDRQHRAFRQRARALGLELFGDLQVGMSERDAWAARAFTLGGWWLGAPPSRTNPEGQAWNYPLLDPRRFLEPDGRAGPALAFFRSRLERFFRDYDGVRIDHPHGLVCPWVYPVGPDPGRDVKEDGTRLFESPDRPALAALARVRPEQLDLGRPRHDDDWVRWLEDQQVDRYAILVDAVVEEARRGGAGISGVAAEVLSTIPLPLRRVLARHGLGRFRVTQKADLARPEDGYRAENARPEDWIMMGTHDTPPIWAVAERWISGGEATGRARYLAGRLLGAGASVAPWVERTARSRWDLVQAQCADLFVGPAATVMIFFTDLLGFETPYNEPGIASHRNWSLRVPRDPAAALRRGIAEGRALDLRGAIAAALRARNLDGDGLADRLEHPPS